MLTLLVRARRDDGDRGPTDEEVAAIAAAAPYDPEGKFCWSDDDIEILEMGPDGWDLTDEDNGATILVQDANGLMTGPTSSPAELLPPR